MSRIFTRKTFSTYLGENRALNDIITKYVESPDKSILFNFDASDASSIINYRWYDTLSLPYTPGSFDGYLWYYGANATVVPDYGGGIYTDGSNDYMALQSAGNIIVPSKQLIPYDSPWTLTFWFEPYDTYVGYQRLIDTYENNLIFALGNNELSFYTPTDGWNTWAQSAVTVSTPYFFTLTYDGTTLSYYRNGVFQDDIPATIEPPVNTNNRWYLSTENGTTDFFEGVWYRMNGYSEAKDAAWVAYEFYKDKTQYGY
jgi:hypothetical protein